MTAAAIITQSFLDYHAAKKILKNRKITDTASISERERRFREKLTKAEQGIVLLGKTAWEWFTQKPINDGTGWTLEKCCSVLRLDPDAIRAEFRKPRAYRAYCANVVFYRPPPEGAKNANAKIGEWEVRKIIAFYKDGLTQREIGEKFLISQRQVSDIVNGKKWKHICA